MTASFLEHYLLGILIALALVCIALLIHVVRLRRDTAADHARVIRYRAAVEELDRYCGNEFPMVRLVCEFVDSNGEGKSLMAGTFSHDGRCTIMTFRQLLRRRFKK